MSAQRFRLAITAGEPAGIGPDLCLQLARHSHPADLVIIADPAMLEQRAAILGMRLQIRTFDAGLPFNNYQDADPGSLTVLPVSCNRDVHCGQPDPENASYVLDTLRQAVDGCQNGIFDAMVTAPVHKGIINDAGFEFTGHTEFLQQLTRTDTSPPACSPASAAASWPRPRCSTSARPTSSCPWSRTARSVAS